MSKIRTLLRTLFKKPAAIKSAHYLSIVLRHRDVLLFERYGTTNKPAPILIPHAVSEDASVEDDLNTIHQHLFTQYGLDPDNVSITFQYHAASLEPLAAATFSLAISELNEEDFNRLKPNFLAYPVARVMLEREHNLFFELISREYLPSH